MRTRFLILTAVLAAMSLSWITTLAGSPEAIVAASDLGRLQGCWTGRAALARRSESSSPSGAARSTSRSARPRVSACRRKAW